MPLPKESELFYGKNLTDEQKAYVDGIFDNKITFVNAKAGTGKTMLAVGSAKVICENHNRKAKTGKDKYELLYTFTPVEEDSLGHRPGNTEEKESDYLGPLIGALKEIGEDPRLAIYREENPEVINKGAWVHAESHTFQRGVTHRNKVVIIDEAQNWTKKDLRKMLTRLTDSCYIIVIGHDGQCDLKKPGESGFVPYINHFKDEPYCGVYTLTKNFRGVVANKADELE